MKKIICLFAICMAFVTTASAQTYEDGFREGILNGEYFKAQVIAQHPEYGISYTWEYHNVSYTHPGGIDPNPVPPGQPIANAVLIIGQINDPSTLIFHLFTDPTIVSARQYLLDQYNNDPSPYNHGLFAGFDARVSGKY